MESECMNPDNWYLNHLSGWKTRPDECNSCRFYKKVGVYVGACQRFAPSVGDKHPGLGGKTHYSMYHDKNRHWPQVSDYDWCREYQRKC